MRRVKLYPHPVRCARHPPPSGQGYRIRVQGLSVVIPAERKAREPGPKTPCLA